MPESLIKRCPKCGLEKIIAYFGKNKARKDGLQGYCKPCMLIALKASRKKNSASWKASDKRWRDKNKERLWASNIKFAYNISVLEYSKLLVSQNGKCAICGVPSEECTRKFSVDHDHETGQIRGLLCDRCNRGIGFLKDNPTILISAANYLLAKKTLIPKEST
jgi:hypothetical protein